jgi:hypothetical protein
VLSEGLLRHGMPTRACERLPKTCFAWRVGALLLVHHSDGGGQGTSQSPEEALVCEGDAGGLTGLAEDIEGWACTRAGGFRGRRGDGVYWWWVSFKYGWVYEEIKVSGAK